MAEDKMIGLPLINKALPLEMLEKVFKELDLKNLYSARLTCKYWKQLIDKSRLVEETLSKILESCTRWFGSNMQKEY